MSAVTSDPEEPEDEEDELQVAAQQLTEDFLRQVIQDEEGQGKTTDDGEWETGSHTEEVESLRHAAPLAAILGKLPSAVGLGLQQTFEKSSEKLDGETGNCHRHSLRPGDLLSGLFLVISQMSGQRAETWTWMGSTTERLRR